MAGDITGMTLEHLRDRKPDGDPRSDLYDWCLANELLATKYENERRAQRAAEQRAKQKAPGR